MGITKSHFGNLQVLLLCVLLAPRIALLVHPQLIK